MKKKYYQYFAIFICVLLIFNVCHSANNTWDGELVTIIGNIITKIMEVVGGICALMIIIGGIVWMTARDDANQLKLAKSIVVAALIGLTVIVASAMLMNTIIKVGV